MKQRRFLVMCAVAVGSLSLALAACGSPAAPAPTAAPAKAAAPAATSAPAAPAATTKPAAPAATAAPAAAAWPEKGKSITIIVGAAAGGGNDVAARLLAPLMEKDLGVPVQVVNKPGAGWQVGLTEVAQAKPDGYTIGYSPIPQAITIYLDEQRKAVFKGNSFQTLAMHVIDPGAVVVKADSPYKTFKEMVDAAKAKPESIKVSDTGILSDDNLAMLDLEQQSGAKFAAVHFEGGAPAMTALLGGHVDAQFANVGEVVTRVKAGEMRALAIFDKEESSFLPGVKTAAAQGYNIISSSSRGIVGPAGMPKDVVTRLSQSILKGTKDEEHIKKMTESGFPLKYMDADGFRKYWDEMETQVKPLVPLAR